MSARRESACKEFVSVMAVYWAEGRVEPLRVQRENGETLVIARVTEARRCAAPKAGGCGVRYTCRVPGGRANTENTLYLFDDDGFWFIEKEQGAGDAMDAVSPPSGEPGVAPIIHCTHKSSLA